MGKYSNAVLIVDFDKTLITVDLFKNQFCYLFFHKPFKLYRLLSCSEDWIDFKSKVLYTINNNITFDSIVNRELMTHLNIVQDEFNSIVVVSASPQNFLNDFIPNHLFHAIHGSTDINLKGEKKLMFIQNKFGSCFGYIGDSRYDNVIFESSLYAVKVSKKKLKIIKNVLF